MHDSWPDDDRPRFWKGLAIALVLGGAAWLSGAAMTAFVVWRVGRLG